MSQWFRQQRIEWIIENVKVFGFMKRDHVMRKFEVSPDQATKDLRSILQNYPGLMAYNTSTRRYELIGDQDGPTSEGARECARRICEDEGDADGDDADGGGS
jgi:hypothetical protein